MPKGYLALVLHSHLPFVRHPEHEEFLEEDWLYEALTETYIPLLNVFQGLVDDNIPFKITLSLSPTLLSMLNDPLLQSRYKRYLERNLELADKEIQRTLNQPEFHPLAKNYQQKLQQTYETFVNDYRFNLTAAFKKFQETGHLEIITTCATHGYLPLMQVYPEAVRAQVRVAVQTHEKFLGRKPEGIWLPECGYGLGIETFLEEAGLRYFFLDTHGLTHASPKPKFGVHAPILCANKVAAFGRDPQTAKQVWSSKEGYPGDNEYRDFYRDIGFDLDTPYIRPYIAVTGERKMTGFKYHRITGKTDHKEPYRPEKALQKAAEHAEHFLTHRVRQIEKLFDSMERKPIIVAPYDSELFGHWWWEGPDWLNFLIRKTDSDQDIMQLTTPADYLLEYPQNPSANPSPSSWGQRGHNEYWLNEKNDWVYPHLHKAAQRMVELAEKYFEADGLEKKALNQAARELLLAQSSDWAFIMTSGTMVEYAVQRVKTHINQFNQLYHAIRNNAIDPEALRLIESRDNIFPDIDFRVYLSRSGAVGT